MKYKVFSTPIGWIKITEDQGFLVKLDLLDYKEDTGPYSFLLEETEKQLKLYFKGELQKFDLPVKFSGTDFQKKFGKLYRIFLMDKLDPTNKWLKQLIMRKRVGP